MIQIDMPMPDGCSECRFDAESGFCKAMPDNFCGYTKDYEKPEWCPLKEQEAVKPKIDAFGHPYCPRCKVLVYQTWSFCPHCGQGVKWK